MRDIVVGSFVGFVLAAAFLAACGSSGEDGGGARAATAPGEVSWSALKPTFSIVTGANVSRNDTWTSTTSYDNSAPENRVQYAAFDLLCNVDSFQSGEAMFDIGVLPTTEASNFATDPQWLGTVEMDVANSRRVVLSNVRIPPLRFRFALRLRHSASATARVLAFSMTGYNEQQQ